MNAYQFSSSRAQRGAKRSGALRCRTGIHASQPTLGPGSAAHRSALRRVRDDAGWPRHVAKAVAAIVLSFALALPLAACGKKGPLDPPPPKEEKHKKEEQAAPAP